jgi:hypothetical protein
LNSAAQLAEEAHTLTVALLRSCVPRKGRQGSFADLLKQLAVAANLDPRHEQTLMRLKDRRKMAKHQSTRKTHRHGRGHRQRGHCSTLSISLPAGEESLVLAETVILSVSAIVYEKLCAALRLAKALSQEDLAFRAGIHRTYLGGIEPDLDFEAKGTA